MSLTDNCVLVSSQFLNLEVAVMLGQVFRVNMSAIQDVAVALCFEPPHFPRFWRITELDNSLIVADVVRVDCNSGYCTLGIEVVHVSFHDSHYRHFDRRDLLQAAYSVGRWSGTRRNTRLNIS